VVCITPCGWPAIDSTLRSSPNSCAIEVFCAFRFPCTALRTSGHSWSFHRRQCLKRCSWICETPLPHHQHLSSAACPISARWRVRWVPYSCGIGRIVRQLPSVPERFLGGVVSFPKASLIYSGLVFGSFCFRGPSGDVREAARPWETTLYVGRR
jgi:hypothetical protein